MNAMISTSSFRLPSFIARFFTTAPSPREITSFDEMTEYDLETYLLFVADNVRTPAPEVCTRIDAITRNPNQYSFRIRMLAEHACIVHGVPKTLN